MKIYHYRPDTGEYLGESTARSDPEEPGRFLVPANASRIAPPATRENEAIIFNGTKWQIVDDYRGTTYWLDDGSQHDITELGVRLPQGAMLVEPVKEFSQDEQIAELEAFVENLLDETAQSRGYNDTIALCSYGDSGIVRYDTEARAFKSWRGRVWMTFYQLVNEAKTGNASLPREDDLAELLPELLW